MSKEEEAGTFWLMRYNELTERHQTLLKKIRAILMRTSEFAGKNQLDEQEVLEEIHALLTEYESD